jgi:protein lin-54
LLSIKIYCFSKAFLFNLIQGVAVLSIEEPKQASEENNACVKEEKCEIDKQLVIYQATDLAPAENLLTTPSMVECRFVCQLSCICTSVARILPLM